MHLVYFVSGHIHFSKKVKGECVFKDENGAIVSINIIISSSYLDLNIDEHFSVLILYLPPQPRALLFQSWLA